jgi:hypothetical protein
MTAKVTKKHYLQTLALWATIAVLMFVFFPFEALTPAMLKYNEIIVSFMACNRLFVAISVQAGFCLLSAFICVLMLKASVWRFAETKRSFMVWWITLATLLFVLSTVGLFMVRHVFSSKCA